MMNCEHRIIDVDGVEYGKYYISEYGDIYSTYLNKYMKPSMDKNGYLRIKLSKGHRGKCAYFRIQTLVALTFIGNPDSSIDDPTVDHIDGDILNNHYANLRWLSRTDNSKYRPHKAYGERDGTAILKEYEVHEICKAMENGEASLSELAEKYKVDKSTISNIRRRANWKHISCQYGEFKKLNNGTHRRCNDSHPRSAETTHQGEVQS